MKKISLAAIASGALLACCGVTLAADVTPSFKHGINLSRTFGFPVRVGLTNNYQANPYTGNLSLSTLKDADLDRLASLGFDWVRLPVDPGPFLASTGATQNALFAQLTNFILKLHARKIAVLVDIHPASYQTDWGIADILGDVSKPKFTAYTNFAVQLANQLKAMPADKIALELLNEPQSTCKRTDGEDWTVTQKKVFKLVRSAAPKLALVVTGPCWSSVDGLMLLNAADYDALTMYDVHFYDPHEFTHQSLSWSASPINRISGLSYPYTSSSIAANTTAISKFQANAPYTLTAATVSVLSDTTSFLNRYYTVTKPDRSLIEARLTMMSNWALKNKVSASNILIGEFGAVRWLPAIENGSRGRWVADVKAVAESRGFGWAVWDYDTTFGIITDYKQTLDMDMVKALGLTVK